MPYTASRLSSLLIAMPLASASSLSQLDRQLRQKPARFIKSMFWTSLRERRCSTRRRKAAASSSVLVLSSIAMSVVSSFCVSLLILGGCCHRFCHIAVQMGADGRDSAAHFLYARLPPLTVPAGLREIVNDLI